MLDQFRTINPRDCSDVPADSTSGTYRIYPDNSDVIDAYCDMETDDGDWTRPNNLSLVCLYLSLYISFLLFGHFFLFFWLCVSQNKELKLKFPNNKKEIYNDKNRHTRDRLFGL